jgi:hypothetical protein
MAFFLNGKDKTLNKRVLATKIFIASSERAW